jgi:hypothetical protein
MVLVLVIHNLNLQELKSGCEVIILRRSMQGRRHHVTCGHVHYLLTHLIVMRRAWACSDRIAVPLASLHPGLGICIVLWLKAPASSSGCVIGIRCSKRKTWVPLSPHRFQFVQAFSHFASNFTSHLLAILTYGE